MSDDRPTVSEVLVKKENAILLARVLLWYDIPLFPYPKSGLWSYLIGTPTGVTVFDAGPYWRTITGHKGKKTENTRRILDTVRALFPARPVREILVSHYHFDHLQNAADLQAEAARIYGVIPPIRLHANDLLPKKFLSLIPDSAANVLQSSGYTTYTIGTPLQDGEVIAGSSFRILHTPGHTSGCVGLISDTEKIVVTGTQVPGFVHPLVRVAGLLAHEDRKESRQSNRKIMHPGYRCYYHHKTGIQSVDENLYPDQLSVV